ncbi:MAG TPA: hypothetical protein VK861_04115, partial [Bacteroidales bacterium]|nr:hypothetical protein [Bacteroidales bacterium]
LDAISGYTTRSVPTPENGFPQRPQWSADGSEITVIMLTNRGEGVYTYNIAADKWRVDIEPSSNDLQVARIRTDTLFFISSAGGTDNLFYITPEGETFRATKSRYGIADFNLAGNEAIFSDYDYRGYKIAVSPIGGERYDYESKAEIPSSFLNKIDLPSAPQTGLEIGGDGQRIIPVSYRATPYRKWQNILNVHSWTPFYFDLDEIRTDPSAIKPGVTLFSQNLLSTVITSLGYEYSDGEHKLHSGITWKGWYPVVDFRLTYGGEPIIERDDDVTLEPSTRVPALIASTEIYLPLRFSSGSFFQYIRPAVSHQYINRYIYDEDLGQYNYGQSFITTRVYFSNTRRSAYRDIFPPLAQVFDYSFTSAPFDSDLYGSISSLRTAFYFPGLFRNNGIRIRLQSEQQRPAKYILFNRIDFPRGYGNTIISGRLKTLSTDYVFPLFYPDLAAGGLFYLKRVRGSLFLDLSEGLNNRYIFENRFVDRKERFFSFGGELLADFNILRFPFDITGGARAGYIPDRGTYFLEAVFSIDIYGFSLG